MYYIDFDNTLYETGKLTIDILKTFAQIISEKNNLDYVNILSTLHNGFNSTTDNFCTYAKKLEEKYSIEYSVFYNCINDIILINGNKYVFDDVIPFLKFLKTNNETICILSYVENSINLNQQSMKFLGSGILEYVDEFYITSRLKFNLELDFSNATIIDDSPRDLKGFYNRGITNIIRAIRPNNTKRTTIKLNFSKNIPEITSLLSLIK